MAKKTKSGADASQLLLSGTLTEDQVFRQVMRKLGAKGGSVNSKAQEAARRRNLLAANERRAKIRKDSEK